MAGKTTPVLLVTANVGSIFEDPSVMLKIWTEEFLATVAKLDPKFIAVHCQEVGGKNYERSMKHVEDFVRLFMSSDELRLFDKVRVFLDEDYSSAENFTALGNLYFVHESLSDVSIWDFSAKTFVPAIGKEIHSGNIEAVTTKEKSKFPQDFFPECKWSRKGFLRTRWNLNGTVFDLINIHLFHDASNFIAMEAFPSVYCKNRRRALEHTLERFHNDDYETAPFFVFGDFNFRTDTQGVINKLAGGLNPVRVQSNKNTDHTKLQYRDDESQVVLSLGKKEFSHADHQSVFFDENGQWLREFDRELEPFLGRLFEFPITFPPSYPFEEDENGSNNYMKTRCPAWCDRVLLSSTAKHLVNHALDSGGVEYGLMGPNTRMGDHKPVYLKAEIINEAGTVPCCTWRDVASRTSGCSLCFGSVVVREPWPSEPSLVAAPLLTLSLDAAAAASSFLAPPHAALLHEPYTPESMESPSSSPIPLRVVRDFGNVVDWNEAELSEKHLRVLPCQRVLMNCSALLEDTDSVPFPAGAEEQTLCITSLKDSNERAIGDIAFAPISGTNHVVGVSTASSTRVEEDFRSCVAKSCLCNDEATSDVSSQQQLSPPDKKHKVPCVILSSPFTEPVVQTSSLKKTGVVFSCLEVNSQKYCVENKISGAGRNKYERNVSGSYENQMEHCEHCQFAKGLPVANDDEINMQSDANDSSAVAQKELTTDKVLITNQDNTSSVAVKEHYSIPQISSRTKKNDFCEEKQNELERKSALCCILL